MPHDHHHAETGDRRLALAVGVNLALTVAQIVGGLVSGSLALIADAIHNLSDALALVIAAVARRLARKPADDTMTFGYARAETVAALVNLTTLVVIGLWLLWEGTARLIDPQPVAGWTVVIVAVVALVADLATVALTTAMAKDSMNVRAAWLHNIADALGSVAVIVSGTLILLYDWRLADPIATLAIAVYILWHALHDVGPVIRLLMNASPDDLDLDDVRATLAATEGVEEAHHVHLWRIDERRTSVEAHLVVADDGPAAVARAKAALREAHGIEHATLEVEPPGRGCA